jgi:hypothetical protein
LELVGGDFKRAYMLGQQMEKAFEKQELREASEDVTEDLDIGSGTNEKVDDEIPF